MTGKEKSSVNNWGDCKEWGSWSNYPGHPMKQINQLSSHELAIQKMIEEASMRYSNYFYGLSLPTNHPFYHLTLPNNMEKKMKREKFWMIVTFKSNCAFLESGNNTSQYYYHNKAEAKSEAERLAKVNPGKEFFVVESVAVVKTQSFVWDSIGSNSTSQDNPF